MPKYDVMRPTIRLTLKMPCSCQHYSLQVSTHTGTVRCFPGLVSQEELSSLRCRLGDDVDSFKDKVGTRLDLTQRVRRMNDAMHWLHNVGTTFLWDLLGGYKPKLRNLCDEALHYWPKGYPPVIELRGERQSMFPIELLPLLGDGPYRRLASPEDLTTYATRYVGFRTVVYRTMAREGRGSARNRHLILDGQRLPVKLFYHARLGGAIREAYFLRLLSDATLVQLEGPWPEAEDSPSGAAAIQLLNEHLNNPQLSLGGDLRAVGDQVQHFACHCDSAPPRNHRRNAADQHEFPRIRLAAPMSRPLKITREDLILASEPAPPPPATKQPILFMNACHTSRIEPDTATSFVKYFLDRGNPAFIGTVSGVPDLVAAEFSRLFYKELIRGRNVGTAIWSARNRVLRRRANPLGLLYTSFGDPRISTYRVSMQEVEKHAA